MTAPAAARLREPHHLRHRDERDAERSGRRPRAAGDHADQRADRGRRQEEDGRVEHADAVVDDGRDRAGHVPGPDQGADREQDEDRAHRRRDAADGCVRDRRRRVAVLERDQARERGAQEQRDLQGPVGRADAEEPDRDRDQRDQDDDRQHRVEQARRPRLPTPISRGGVLPGHRLLRFGRRGCRQRFRRTAGRTTCPAR